MINKKVKRFMTARMISFSLSISCFALPCILFVFTAPRSLNTSPLVLKTRIKSNLPETRNGSVNRIIILKLKDTKPSDSLSQLCVNLV